MTISNRCPVIRPRLSGYHDGVLPAAHREEIRGHLAQCKGCSAELAAIARVSERVAAARMDARPGFNVRLAGRIGKEQAAHGAWAARARLARRLSFVSAAALMAGFIGLGPALMRNFQNSGPEATDEQILSVAIFGPGADDEEGDL